MRRRPVLAVCLLLQSAAFAQGEKTPDGERVARVCSGLRTAVAAAGSTATFALDQRRAFYGVPGVAVAVVDAGAIAWTRGDGTLAKGGGPVGDGTLFQAASISKPLVATAFLRLVQAGRLELDEPVNDHLESWQLPANEFTRQQAVTLRHLLSHTAGATNHTVGTYAADAPLPTLLQVLDGTPPARTPPVRVDFTPGSRFRYSGGGYSILQQVLIDVAEEPFPAAMQRLVLDPLGMKDSVYSQPLAEPWLSRAATGHRYGQQPIAGKAMVLPEMAAGGLWTTARDLAQFLVAVLGAIGKGNEFLTPESARLLATEVKGGMALGMFVQGRGDALEVWHGGSNPGFRAFLVGLPARGQGAVVLTNSDTGGELAQEILRAVALEYGWPARRQREVATTPVAADEPVAALAGTYRWGSRDYTVQALGDGLQARDEREFPSPLLHVGTRRWVSAIYATELEFAADGSKVSLQWPDEPQPFVAERRR